MNKTQTLMAIAVAIMAQGCATPQPVEPGGVELKKPETSIPFINQRSAVLDWQADGREGVWIEDAHHNWYYAKLQSPCFGLDFAMSIGFQTTSSNTLDRFGYVIVPDEPIRCPIMSFTASDPPPKKAGRRPAEDAPVK